LVASRAIAKLRPSFDPSHETRCAAKVDEPTQFARGREHIGNEQQTGIAEQQHLLAHDHDIWELTGERDLNIGP